MDHLVDPGWKDRRVFLTGHTGFKGSWLGLWLAKLGARVCGYALAPPAEPNLFTVARVDEAVEDVRGDLLDLHRLSSSMREFCPEVVFHLAAQSLVRRSYADPVGTYATNVLGTAHVLESVRHTPSVRAVVVVTSDKCYENREWNWGYREQDVLGGRDPYSNSKACAELVSNAFRDSFFSTNGNGAALATGRAGNVIGGGDWAEDRLIPDLMRGFLAGRPVFIRNPTAVRPWQHVLEPLHGYLMLAERLLQEGSPFATAWNFGPRNEDTRSVSWIARSLAELWGDGAAWERDAGTHPHEASLLKLDCSQARERLHWCPMLDLPAALEMIVTWFRAYQSGHDMQRTTLDQIDFYQRLCAEEAS